MKENTEETYEDIMEELEKLSKKLDRLFFEVISGGNNEAE